jgi:hypothetical protein
VRRPASRSSGRPTPYRLDPVLSPGLAVWCRFPASPGRLPASRSPWGEENITFVPDLGQIGAGAPSRPATTALSSCTDGSRDHSGLDQQGSFGSQGTRLRSQPVFGPVCRRRGPRCAGGTTPSRRLLAAGSALRRRRGRRRPGGLRSSIRVVREGPTHRDRRPRLVTGCRLPLGPGPWSPRAWDGGGRGPHASGRSHWANCRGSAADAGWGGIRSMLMLRTDDADRIEELKIFWGRSDLEVIS